jgi:hypothetical protein
MTQYAYTNLTSALRDKASPLRRYFDLRFPNVRPLQNDFRSCIGEMKVVPRAAGRGGANGGTLGAAFDFRMRFQIDSGYFPDIAMHAFRGRWRESRSIKKVIRHAHKAAQGKKSRTDLDRACWALALCTEVYRAGLVPGSPLSPLLRHGRFTSRNLLALIPNDALRQLEGLDYFAQKYLLPYLSGPVHLGPTFDASVLCAADADLISDGLLLDFKTSVKGNSLSREDLYQLLGYAFFDFSDRYAIDRIGIYSARFAGLVVWDLSLTLEMLAGEPVSLEEERARVWKLLGGRLIA